MADGQITRKDIITDDALSWGEDYAKNLEPAIAKQKEFVETILAFNEANKKVRQSSNSKELANAQKEANAIGEKAVSIWKEQNQLELALISTKKKNELATEGTNRALIKERTILNETNKLIREETKERLGLVSSYEKLNKLRIQAQKTYADLLTNEKASTAEIVRARIEFEKLDARVKAVDLAIKNYSKNIGNYSSAFQGLNQTARELISTFGLVTGVALFGTIMKDIFSTVREFDRQLIAVGKTTNIEGENLKKFGAEVVELGDKLDGVSVQGLLRSAEVAGTLGVKGTENILKFSESIEKLKLTSDIISDEQVQNFAKFIEVSQDSFENADRLGSVMTQLGNNFATTEGQILSNATEIQKGISIYNASADGVLGLGAATSALGSEAETSRSAIQSTFKVIDQAVSSGKNLEQVLKLTGLTQSELSKQFNKDATGVFVKFVAGLSKAKEEGQNLNNILDSVEITEKRATTVIGALAANYDILANSVTMASQEYEENLALNREVAAASESINSIIGDIKDKWDAYVLSTNEANGASVTIAKTLKFVRDNLKDIIDGFVKYGTVLLTYFGIMKLINFVTTTYTALKTAAAAAELRFALATGVGRASVLAQAEAVKAATIAQTGLNTAMTATPWGVIFAAIAAVVVAYKVFNDELSETEEMQKRINKQIENQKKLLEETKKNNEEYYNSEIKQIENQFELKRKKYGASKELDKQENEAKKKRIKDIVDVNQMEINANRSLLNEISKNSETKIKSLEKEAIKLREIADRTSFWGNELAAEEAEKELNKLKESTTNSKNALVLKNNLLIEENKKYNEQVSELNRQAALINAESVKEQSEKEKKEREAAYKKLLEARKKHWKEVYEAQKKADLDAFNLSQFRLEKEIEFNDSILENDKYSSDERLDALDESNALLLAKNKEALEFQLKQLGKYNEDIGKFVRQLSDIEINELINTGKTKKKLTDEQTLIFEKYQLGLTNILDVEAKKRQSIIDSEVSRIQKSIDAQLQLQENSLNQELVTENDRYALELESAQGNFRLIEQARDKHERELLKIQNKYALQGTKLQIASLEKVLTDNDTKLEKDRISADKRAQIVADLERFKKEQSDLETGNYINNLIRKEELEQQAKSRISELSQELAYSLIDLSNTIFGVNISNIDNEIAYWEDYYNNQIELAGNDAQQKALIQAEAEKKRKDLEKARRKEEYKAAVVAKIMAGAQIGIDLARTLSAIQLAAAQLDAISFGTAGTPYRILQTTLAIGTAATQAAAVALTPLPKYEKGTQGKPHKGGPAIVGEVRPEVIIEPGKKPYIVDVPSVLNLAKGTEVIPSIDEYEKLKRTSIMASIQIQGRKMDQVTANKTFDNAYSKEIIDELRKNTEAVKRSKANINIQNNVDIGYEIWKLGNTKWN